LGDSENAPAGAFRHKMTEKATGPTWLKIGGLLTGVAALLTAIATIISTVVNVWPERSSSTDARESGPHTSQVASNDDQEDTTISGVPKPLETIPNPLSPAADAKVINLVRYAGDGCVYAVEVLEAREDGYRVRFPFGLATMVPPSDVRAARHQPSDLQLGAVVFVPAKRSTAPTESYDFYKAATIEDILGSTVHARFKQESACPVGQTLLALPASNVLVGVR